MKLKFERGKIQRQITSEVNKVLERNDLKDELGKFAVERIRFQARIGQPLNDNGEIPLLKESTILQREYLAKYNRTHPVFEPGLGNMTFTGQLLNGLGFEKMKRGFRFVWKRVRKPYNTGPNSKQKGPLTNERLAGFLEDKGIRAFSARGIRKNRKFNSQLNKIVLAFLRRFLKKS